MKFTFIDSKLRKLCEQQSIAQRQLGKGGARKLHARLTDIAAVGSVQELVAGHPHPLKGDRAGQFALNLEGGKRLVFKPDSDAIPLKKDGSIDWANVTEVCIVFIGDYHD